MISQSKVLLLYFTVTFAIFVLHVAVAPFTKVEESFNIQAVHDLLYAPINAFDHLTFSGVVPRSFIGPILIAGLLAPFKYFAKIHMLIGSRVTIALFNALSLTSITSSLPQGARFDFILLTVSQFHTMFWGSRTLPNTFALILFQFALGYWIRTTPTHPRKMIQLLISAIVIFRAELAPISGIMVLTDLYSKKYRFKTALLCAIPAIIVAISCTLLIDSYFWKQRFLWPELQVFIFNGCLNFIQA